ncbi:MULTISPECIES: Hpt domain-containing protein [Tenacibaculum]|uniref:Hpt domain-containing protein n=2 Tax=Tenacibaculum TaxID=104267 RepID=A0AAE9ML63_9FLAO|nr:MULTISPECIES: Hpt domain-containing protein [Tenacibaculum]GFD75229.1 histidine kinase [Tenacibaculum sp. KUL113]GFD83445.1 histidine kinase [Tenacibaculum sp. KUL118]GFD93159.1 histidine kinase [Alteromonas sp. KUL154]GFE01643.1 histidine kinase [Alteromonas sp. KUL156]AZJ31492.1 Hpt domain-containing protein [Tenacibaculum mesophilum]
METPNLNYVNELARGDESIKNTLIDIIKTEFPEEKNDYYESLEERDCKKLEDNVHRIKHKISILGLEKSYELANEFEHNLRDNKIDKVDEFEKILVIITNYLKTI